MIETRLILLVPPGERPRNPDPRYDEVRVDSDVDSPRVIRNNIITAPGANDHVPDDALAAFLDARANAPDGSPFQAQIDALFAWLLGVSPDEATAIIETVDATPGDRP